MRKKVRWGIAAAVFAVIAILLIWTAGTEKAAHYVPDYPREPIEELLGKEELTEADYALLWEQTGLARAGIDELLAAGRREEILYLQERFFAPVEYSCRSRYLVYRCERLEAEADGMRQRTETGGAAFLPTAHTGDILITFSGHVFGWRSGHAALVVDGRDGLTLEAVTLGCNSRICEVSHWREYPCFVLLRLKGITEAEGEKIAAYASKELADLPYELWHLTERTDGGKDEGETLSGTQCAHLVWAAFYHFGYDLDSDGGRIVTPADLYGSGLLEVVQIYGMRAEKQGR